MEITVVGKYGPYPEKGGASSCFLVRGKKNIVLDMGSGSLSKLQNFISFSQIDAIVLSHLHYDHFCDILPLSYYFLNIGKKVKLYCPSIPRESFELIKDLGAFEVEEISEKAQFCVGGVNMSFKRMTHPIESYAIKLEENGKSFVYSGDTNLNESIVPFLRGAMLAFLDCGNARNNPVSPHLSLSEALFIQKQSGVKAVAVHINPFLKYEESEVKIASEGETYTI